MSLHPLSRVAAIQLMECGASSWRGRCGASPPRLSTATVSWIIQETADSGGLACVLPPYRNAAEASCPSPPRKYHHRRSEPQRFLRTSTRFSPAFQRRYPWRRSQVAIGALPGDPLPNWEPTQSDRGRRYRDPTADMWRDTTRGRSRRLSFS